MIDLTCQDYKCQIGAYWEHVHWTDLPRGFHINSNPMSMEQILLMDSGVCDPRLEITETSCASVSLI